ncbi:MAG TPA: maleylpyruvate isomerase family mycothiol-dependent enzyme [Nocardioidaceae bacterium]|nr:maleylpyruvate isomerase family mycothiol-dependent enzyme [Nocardioidaceae bacterium]
MALQRYAATSAVDFVSAFAAAAAEVVETIPSCDMAAAVPACPPWSTYDLVRHLGNIHAWAATIVETGSSTPEQNDRPRSRRAKSVARWYTGKAEDLLQVLRHAQPDEECWTFSARHHTQAFWPRRQAHETLIHLVDLHQTLGTTPDIPADIAADGVAEVLEVFLPRMHAKGLPARLSAPLRLHATDTDDAWLLTPARLDDGSPIVRRLESPDLGGLDVLDVEGHRVATVRASASDLMQLLWKRRSPDESGIDLEGNEDRILDFLDSPLTP